MTFDQLMERQSYISKKYSAAYASGNPEILNQILSHLEAIRQAMYEIGYKQRFDESEKDDPFKDSIA